MIPDKIRNQIVIIILPTAIQYCMEVWQVQSKEKGKEKKKLQKEEIKSSLFSDDTAICVENLIESIKNLLEPIGKLSDI